jgi:thiol-disulfide isomerase/thioredoxin
MKRTLLLLTVVATGFAGRGIHPAKPATSHQLEIAAGEIGSRLPEFSVKDLRGKELSSADLKGKVVVVDFWATWCQPCKKEMPGYQKLVDLYGKSGFAVIGLKFDTMADTEDPVVFARKIGVRYPLAVASDQLRQAFGGIEGLPTTMIYDRQGILRKKIVGFEYTSVVESDLKPFL